MDEEDIRKKIEQLEKQLEELKVSLLSKPASKGKKDIKVGDKVTIKNPSKGQERIGKVTRINDETGYVFVRTETQHIRRLKKNLRKVQE